MTELQGVVMEIVFHNPENGYTVLELDASGKLVTCVGNIPFIQPGEYVRFFGAYTTHKVYGDQFKVASMQTRMPEDDESIKLFLSGGMIKGVGEVLAARIVEAFHADTFAVIEHNPLKLAEVRGVSKNAALSIQAQFRDLAAVRTTVAGLQSMGMTVKQALAAFEVYGAAAADIIAQNPYRLMDDVPGFGFERADKIAAQIGIEQFASLRVYSGIRHVLNVHMERNGHTCLPRAWLLRDAACMLGASEDEIDRMVDQLIFDRRLTEATYNGVCAVALAAAQAAESYAAYKLTLLAAAQPRTEVSRCAVDQVLKNSELSEAQERAVLSATEHSVCVITGGPGTGKTTILNQLISIFEKSGISAVLAAPTGRAAKRMEKATLRPAKTIHRLLEYGATDEDARRCRFQRDEENPLEAEAVIIDETSMVDIFLLQSLLRAVAPGTRLILTGDADQLPSVGPGNVLKDVIASGCAPVCRLTEIFRQQGNIAMCAARVNLGETPDLFTAGDFVFIPANTPAEVQREVQRLVCERIKAGVNLDEVQVICPVKRGQIGVYELNRALRELLNPRLAQKRELQYGDTVFREGDKVMQTSNNYSKEWRLQGVGASLGRGDGVFNGDMGTIDCMDEDQTYILFDGERLAGYERAELDQLEHAYAVTVHKSQGSEFDTVILPLLYGGNDFLTRNLLYTAMTRARKKLYIVGAERTVRFMVGNSRVTRRFTSLKYQLKHYQQMFAGLSEGTLRPEDRAPDMP